MLRDSVAIIVMCTHPREKSMRKSTHGFPSLSYTSMGLRLAALWSSTTTMHMSRKGACVIPMCGGFKGTSVNQTQFSAS